MRPSASFRLAALCLSGPGLPGVVQHRHLQALILAGMHITQLSPFKLFKIGLEMLTGSFRDTVPLVSASCSHLSVMNSHVLMIEE